MKNVLLITYYWPPASGPGVQRWLKMAKYLPELGWQPTVLTVRNGTYPNLDPSLEHDVPGSVRVVRSRSLEPHHLYNLLTGKKKRVVEVGMPDMKAPTSLIKRLSKAIRANWFIPDARIGWNRYALRKARSIIRHDQPDLIITTGPPHSTHLVGLKLKKEFGLPWIADLRDPWTKIYYNQFLNRSVASQEKDEQLEREVIQTADEVMVVSEGMKQEFETLRSDIHVIPNGYDDEDMVNDQGTLTNSGSDHFTLGYIGNFKLNQDIDALWEVLADLIKTDEAFNRHFKLNITGNTPEPLKEKLTGLFEEHVVFAPFIPHKEAFQWMQRVELLLLIIPHVEHRISITTGKIYEYLASRTPILTIGPLNGAADQIMQASSRPPAVDYDNKAAIRSLILEEFSQWQANERRGRKVMDSTHENFERKTITNEVVKILNHLCPETQ